MSKKNTNIEILRIIMIFLIVANHCNTCGYDMSSSPVQFNYFFAKMFTFGTIANHVFLIITGYFMIKSKPNLKKILNLIFQMVFYSVAIYLILVLTKMIPFNKIDLVKSLLPIIFGNWFILYYFVLYLLSPFINKVLLALNKKELNLLLFITLLLFSIIPTFTTNVIDYNWHTLFILDYIIGAYININYDQIKNRYKSYYLIIIFILLILSNMTLFTLGKYFNSSFILENSNYFICAPYSILAIVFAASLVIFAINKKEFHNKIINIIASTTLAVYLIHMNPYLKNIIWNVIIPNKTYSASYLYFAFMLVKSLIVYISCILIELLRSISFKKIDDRISNCIMNHFKKKKKTNDLINTYYNI